MKLSNVNNPETWLKAVVAVMAFCLVFYRDAAIYDLPTAVSFALGLAFMARGMWREYMWVFVLGCVNRETTMLLTLVFAVYFFRRMGRGVWLGGIGLQALIWVMVRLQIFILFMDHPGANFLYRPLENVELFKLTPWLSGLHWAGFALTIWLCARHWRRKPVFLRTAFAVLMPIQLCVYVVLGVAFEVRVFAEVFPVVWVLAVGSD